jgi:hypothetical protein
MSHHKSVDDFNEEIPRRLLCYSVPWLLSLPLTLKTIKKKKKQQQDSHQMIVHGMEALKSRKSLFVNSSFADKAVGVHVHQLLKLFSFYAMELFRHIPSVFMIHQRLFHSFSVGKGPTTDASAATSLNTSLPVLPAIYYLTYTAKYYFNKLFFILKSHSTLSITSNSLGQVWVLPTSLSGGLTDNIVVPVRIIIIAKEAMD